GATSPMAAFAATAASTALPPFSRTAVPARAAIGCSAATIPNWEITMERACERSSAASGVIMSQDTDIARLAAIHSIIRHWRMKDLPVGGDFDICNVRILSDGPWLCHNLGQVFYSAEPYTKSSCRRAANIAISPMPWPAAT